MSRCKLLALSLVALASFLWPTAATFAGPGGGGGHGGGGGGGHGGGHGGGGHGYGGGGYHGGYGGGYRGGYGYGGYGLGGLGYGGYGGLGYNSGYAVAPPYRQGYVDPNVQYVDPSVQQDYSQRQSGYYAPPTQDNSAMIRVFVPPDAKVWIGGEATTKTGEDRTFASPVLTPGKSYTYQIKATWMQDGKPVEQTQKIKVLANETSNVTFGQ